MDVGLQHLPDLVELRANVSGLAPGLAHTRSKHIWCAIWYRHQKCKFAIEVKGFIFSGVSKDVCLSAKKIPDETLILSQSVCLFKL